ncbi:MAG: LON peptidase substrate-binding domain-containing protein [Chitinophagaceae bacterium]|nr:LON peptidase substrate-binding domain-containing protein [Chitinophagaceae bacterium]
MKRIDSLFVKSEDDMDFLPIIPLNEGEQDDFSGVEVPEELALLPLRNTVLFPGVVLPITVGRDKSIKAVNESHARQDKLIAVVAQKRQQRGRSYGQRPRGNWHRGTHCKAN